MNEAQIRERLAKIKALYTGATTDGEREAAAAALHRINLKMAQAQGIAGQEEFRFSMPDAWATRLFIALCRSKGLKPYRYPRMRRTSLCVKAEPTMVDGELWPEFVQMSEVLNQYLGELANHIIAECINPDQADADVVAGIPGPASERSA